VIKAVLIGATLFVTYLSRNIPSRFNESKNQVWILYNVIFFTTILLIVMGTLDPVENGVFAILVSLTICYITILTLLLLLASKFVNIYNKRRHSKKPRMVSSGSNINTGSDLGTATSASAASVWRGFSEEELRLARLLCTNGLFVGEEGLPSTLDKDLGASRTHSGLGEKDGSVELTPIGSKSEQKSNKGKRKDLKEPITPKLRLHVTEADILRLFQQQLSANSQIFKEQDMLVDRANAKMNDVERELNFLVALLWALDLDEKCFQNSQL